MGRLYIEKSGNERVQRLESARSYEVQKKITIRGDPGERR